MVFMLYPHNYTKVCMSQRQYKDILSSSIAALKPDIPKTETKEKKIERKSRNAQMHRTQIDCSPYQLSSLIAYSLQLGLLGLSGQVGEEDVTEFRGGFVEVVAHAMGAEALADDVEVEAGRNALV
jgi:hypothetical protein